MAAVGQESPSAADDLALVATVEGAIGPATTRYVDDILDAAETRGAEVIILRLDTPGGLSESMRDIIRRILSAPIPIIVYVAPSGARAASAGTYILYASHLAAMSPGTNLGAATPVSLGGGGLPTPGGEEPPKDQGEEDGEKTQEEAAPSGEAMRRKVINDSVAYIRGLAELRGRNADWAEQAVRQGASLTAGAALERGVIDLLASSLDDLLEKADGREVKIGEREVTLATRDLTLEEIEPGWLIEVLSVVTNPNIALILMMIGIYGLIFEFMSPGTIGPGVVGVICLVLGLYALNMLPLDYTGFGLIILGVALMVAEAVTPTFGVLGIGGLVAFVLGAAFLLDSDSPQFRLSWPVIAGTAAASAAILSLLMGYLWRTHRRPQTTGAAEIVGQRAKVIEWGRGRGYVQARGERWQARSEASFAPGDTARVERIDGLTLEIVPANGNKDGADL